MSNTPSKDSDDEDDTPATPFRNYVTPAGYKRINDELQQLWKVDRPKLLETITWAVGNGDRSENGDYIYGKRRLREIDRRLRFLSKRLDSSVVVDNAGKDHEQVFFGATVTVVDDEGQQRTVSIVGLDEIDPDQGRVSWISPIAKALLNQCVGDVVALDAPNGSTHLEILEIRYDELA
jgi:transcription elongation factor GreB